MKKLWQVRSLVTLSVAASLFIAPVDSLAISKLSLVAGVYKLTAKTQKYTGEISNYGIFRIGYEQFLIPYISVSLGYTLLFSEGIGGDAGYGMDFGVLLYPLTVFNNSTARTSSQTLFADDIIKPSVGAFFGQRQFNSIQAGYSGFGFTAGVEYMINAYFGLKAEGRYLLLSGATNSTATEQSVYGGLTFKF